MKVTIPDDYQDAVRSLDSFDKLKGQHVTIYRDSVISDRETLLCACLLLTPMWLMQLFSDLLEKW